MRLEQACWATTDDEYRDVNSGFCIVIAAIAVHTIDVGSVAWGVGAGDGHDRLVGSLWTGSEG